MPGHNMKALVSGLAPWFFDKTRNNTIEGHTYPKEPSKLDIGSVERPFRAIYADSLIGSDGGEFDRLVKVSADDPASGYLEDKIAGVGAISLTGSTDSLINISLNTSTLLLRSGLNSLDGDLSVGSGYTIDGVDIGSPGDGLEINAELLRVKRAGASALEIISGGLAVNAGTTITITSNQLEVDQTAAFTWSGQHQFNTNAPKINTNLAFIGGDRTITATGDLTIGPTGLLLYPINQDIRTPLFSDDITGIIGFRHNEHTGGSNFRQLTIGRIKADELYVRIFTADEARVSRGEEFWSRSFGIVEEDFAIPADESTIDVWFEEVAALDGAKLFLPNNWILFRTVDVDTGLTVTRTWFQVVDADGAGTNDYVTREDAVEGDDEIDSKMARQKWRLKRKFGGLTGVKIKKGNVGVDFGLPADYAGVPAIGQYKGQGVVYLSALNETNGPFVQIQTFETVTSDNPQFRNRVRMGNLNGIAGYSIDRFGFAAGNNLGLIPSAGFSGLIADEVDGLKMYNTDIKLYNGSDDTVHLTRQYGLAFQTDDDRWDNEQLYVSWYSDLADTDTYTAPIGRIGVWGESDDSTFDFHAFNVNLSTLRLASNGDNSTQQANIEIISGNGANRIDFTSATVRVKGLDSRMIVGVPNDVIMPVGRFHVYDDNINRGENVGILIEQAGTGDASLHWLLAGGYYFSAGIDQFEAPSTVDGGKWKLSSHFLLDSNEWIVIDPATGTVIINGLDLGGGTAITGLTSSDGSLTIAGSDLVVNSAMYTPTTRIITAGTGLSGGGNLTANRTLSVDFGVVVATSITLAAGDGLTGGGNLTTNRTFDVVAGAGIDVNPNDVALDFTYSPTWTGTHTFNAAPQINANLAFIGGNRTITGSNSITMQPSNDLIFTPGSDVVLTSTKIFRSSDYASNSSGITGFSFFINGSSKRQLDVTNISVDELHSRVFVADATRVDVGEEYWSKSVGIIYANFTTPATDGSTTTIYVEDSPAFAGALFSNNDWIQIRILDVSGSGYTIWGQVSSYTSMGAGADGITYQRWTFTMRDGPNSTVVKKGNVAVDFGAAGQGYVHLSTLQSKNGPWIAIGDWTSTNPYTSGNNKQHVIMGNLNGKVGISSNEWGFATGNDVSLDPLDGGFIGMLSGATAGLKLYNTDIILYESGDEIASFKRDTGLNLRMEDSSVIGDVSNVPSTISWYHDNGSAWINAGIAASGSHSIMDIAITNGDSSATSEMRLTAYGHGGDIEDFPLLSNTHSNIRISSDDDGYIYLAARKTLTFGSMTIGWFTSPDVQGDLTVPSNAKATLHVMNPFPTGDVSYTGILIEEANLRFENATGDLVTMGIDPSDDKFKMAYASSLSGPFLTFNPATGVTTIAGLDGTTALAGVVAGAGISITGDEVAVNSTVVRTTREITTGYGLTGGDTLDVDLTLAIDTDIVVQTSRAISSGDGLTGGGTLTADRTLAVGAGAGITVNANDVAINLAATSGLSLTGGLNIADSIAGDGIDIASKILAVDSTVVRTTRTISTSGALAGGGDLSANRTLSLTLGTNSGLDQTSGLVIDTSVAGNGLTMTSGVINVIALSTGGLTANTNDLQIKLPANSGLTTDATGLYLPSSLAGAGLTLTAGVLDVVGTLGITANANNIQIALGTNSGLDTSSGLVIASSIAGAGLTLTSGVLNVIALSTGGLTANADDLQVKLPTTSGLQTDSTGLWLKLLSTSGLVLSTSGLAIDDSVAGTGLTITSKVLNVIALSTGGLQANADSVQILLPSNSGLLTDATGLYVNPTIAGAGMTMTSGVVNVIAANGSITVGSSDLNVNLAHTFVWTGSHTWSTGVFTFNTDIQAGADLDFIGAARSITNAGGNISITPTGDLVLDPTGLVLLGSGQEFRTAAVDDLVTGITGARLWDKGSNKYQFNVSGMKIDELYARTFVNDGVRINQGEEYWSKSFGVVETDFILPADESTVDVWFENATGLGTGDIFVAGDYLMARIIDWATSISIVQIWFTVDSRLTAGTVDGYKQQWRIKRESGGTTSQVIKKGNTIVDVGQIGSGWIHLNALKDSGSGPFFQIGEFTSVAGSDTPVFTNRVRMGNLDGVAGLSGTYWGFAGGNNLALTPTTGYSGFTIEATNGMKMYNTDVLLYSGATKVAQFARSTGVSFRYGSSDPGLSAATGAIYWHDDIDSPTSTRTASLSAWRTVGGVNNLNLATKNNGQAALQVSSYNSTDKKGGFVYFSDDYLLLGVTYYDVVATTNNNSSIRMDNDGKTQIGYKSLGGISTASWLHIVENTAANNATTGVTIENIGGGSGLGDVMLHWVGSGQRWSMGIDKSDSNKIKIGEVAGFGSAVWMAITPSTGATVLGGAVAMSSTLNVTGNTVLSGHLTMANGMTLTTETIKAVDGSGLIFQDDGGGNAMIILDTTFNVGIGTLTPGTDIVGTYDYPGTVRMLQVDGGSTRLMARGSTNAALDLIDTGATSNVKWMQLLSESGVTAFRSMSDAGAPQVDNILSIAHATGDIDFAGNLTMANAKTLTVESIKAVDSSGLFLQDDAGTTGIFLQDSTMNVGVGIITPTALGSGGSTRVLQVHHSGTSANSFGMLNLTSGSTAIGVVGALAFGVPSLSGVEKRVAQIVAGKSDTNTTNPTGSLSLATASGGTFLSAVIITNATTNIVNLITSDAGITFGDETITIYNEGTWTPVITAATSNPTVTYTNQNGVYTQINKTVHFQIRIVINTISGGSGVVRISLPFTSFATTPQVVSIYMSGVGASSVEPGVAFINTSTAYIGSLCGADNRQVLVANLAATDTILVGGSYMIA